MTAVAALDKQIARYREMTSEQWLAVALDLHALSCGIAREGIRHAHPEADPAEVERLLRHRLELARAGHFAMDPAADQVAKIGRDFIE